MKYAIIENEYFALDYLKKIIRKIRPDYTLVFTAESIEETVHFLKNDSEIRLLFMDIELVDGICFEIFSRVEVTVPIIFTTAYNQFAIDAFRVNSIDYLLKPVSEDSVERALTKLEKMYPLENNKELYNNLNALIFGNRKKERVLVSSNDRYITIKTEDIAYFISEDKYVILVTFSGKRFVTNYANLNQVEDEVSRDLFFRVSRNIIANISSIVQISKYFGNRLKIYLLKSNNEDLSVLISSAKKDSFLRWLNGDLN